MCYLNKLLIIYFLVCACSAKNNTKDVIGFPEVEEVTDLKNKENRQPVYIPAMCPENELYYPGDQKDDWICDCRPAYLYHPQTDKCWPAYRQGPCSGGSYLALPQNSVIPVCEKNPCLYDLYVQWNGRCEKLGSSEPCKNIYSLPATLGVNASSLVVSCVVNLAFPTRFSVEPTRGCSSDCKRCVLGTCVLSL